MRERRENMQGRRFRRGFRAAGEPARAEVGAESFGEAGGKTAFSLPCAVDGVQLPRLSMGDAQGLCFPAGRDG